MPNKFLTAVRGTPRPYVSEVDFPALWSAISPTTGGIASSKIEARTGVTCTVKIRCFDAPKNLSLFVGRKYALLIDRSHYISDEFPESDHYRCAELKEIHTLEEANCVLVYEYVFESTEPPKPASAKLIANVQGR